MKYLLPWQLVEVSGSSMTPTLLPGDMVVVRHGARVRIGSVVLAEFRSRPGLAVLKRVVGGDERGGWVLGSDNARVGADSRELGVGDARAVAVVLLAGRMRRSQGRQGQSGPGPVAALWGRRPRRLAGPPPAGL